MFTNHYLCKLLNEFILKNIEENKKKEYLYTELSKIFGEDGVKLQIMKNFLKVCKKSLNKNFVNIVS